MRIVSLILTASAAMIFAGRADAQLVYQFADSTGTPTNTFSVDLGQTVSIRVYIRDTTAGAPTLSANGGLGSAAVRVSYSNAAAATIVSLASDVVAAAPPWSFGTTNGSVANASAVLNDANLSASGVQPVTDRIFLGTFIFTGLTTGTSNLTAADPNPGNGFDTTDFNNTGGLDSLLTSSNAVINVSAVPEPTSLIAMIAGGVVLGAVRRRRRSLSLGA